MNAHHTYKYKRIQKTLLLERETHGEEKTSKWNRKKNQENDDEKNLNKS